MDKDLYNIMQNLMKEKSSENTNDIMYLGTIYIDEDTPTGNVKIAKDIIAMFDTTPDGNVITKYYDENQNFIAGRGINGELFPSESYKNDDLGFLSEINSLDINEGISLTELDNELNEISSLLGISKDEILTMSKIELDQIIKRKEDNSVDLSDNILPGLDDEEKEKQNEIALENIDSKQEIDLSKKIDDKYTLAEVLGLPTGSKLIVVYSDKIKNNTNSTRFSCIIQGTDGTLENADMLNQVGGKNSDKNIYETNRDGSKVDNKVVQSSYAINSPLIKNGILTFRIGQMGNIEVGYGQMDKTAHNDAFTQRLETREMYPVTNKVRNEFSKNKGTDNISDKMDEIKEHEKNGCSNLSLEEADGDQNTGHIHSDDIVERILSDDENGRTINEVFTPNEIKERFQTIQEKYPNNSIDKNVEIARNELLEDAEHFRNHSR